MVWRAHVHLQLSSNVPGPLCDLGIIDLDGSPQVGARVSFSLDGVTEVGVIEHIDDGPTPTVHLCLS